MLSIENARQLLQRRGKLFASFEPGAMDSVTCAINIAPPNALETHQNIATTLWSEFFQRISESDCRSSTQPRDLSERPRAAGPIRCRDQPNIVAKIDSSMRESAQISLRAAGCGISPAGKAHGQSVVRHRE